MVNARDLLLMPITYDIIVSDFGRDATIEYLRIVATSEKRLINKVLENEHREFFDEYRRIMFTVIGDLAYFKEKAISESAVHNGFLTEDILIGLGSSPMSDGFVDRVSFSVIQEILAAIDRGHQRLRIMIPCNGLTVLAKKIEAVIRSGGELERIVSAYSSTISNLEKITSTTISVETVPNAVIRHLAKTNNQRETLQLLVLGTRGVNEIYRSFLNSYPMRILALTDLEYDLIDKTIVASIGGERTEIESCRRALHKELIQPRNEYSNLVILEACTDFQLGLGLSSLEVFAEAMVSDCYEPVLYQNAA
jgi:hypothetical protein